MLHDKTGLLCEPIAAAFAHAFVRLANTSPCAPDRRATSARTDGILYVTCNMKGCHHTAQRCARAARRGHQIVRLCARAMAVKLTDSAAAEPR